MPLDLVQHVLHGRSLDESQAAALADSMVDGALTSARIAAALTALSRRGETVDEIVGFARAVRLRARRVPIVADGLVDCCGTGGDGRNTLNVSTIAAFIAAGAGCRIAKHGNRGVSSRCGSADVLAALGVRGDLPPEAAAACIESVGLGFLHAPLYHDALQAVGTVRRELGIRTIFNLIGPLANPAGVRRQLIGVPRREWIEPMADAAARLGGEHVMIVHGEEGLDEISPCGLTHGIELRDGIRRPMTLRPEDAGLEPCAAHDLIGGDAEENARIARSILEGKKGGGRIFALLNAAAVICVAGRAPTLRDGAAAAAESIDSGRAAKILEELRRRSREFAV